MKNWVKKIGQNKFQFFFFVGVVGALVLALVIAAVVTPVDEPKPNNPENPPVVPGDQKVDTNTKESLELPFDENMQYVIVRKFYEKDGTKEEQEKALIKYGSSYRTSVGTSYAKSDGQPFDVSASATGTVVEVKENPLYGNYIVIEHDDDIKTYYYGLSETSVPVGTKVNQGDKIGVSGKTEMDKEAGNHVYFKVVKGNEHLNPEKAIGKELASLE